MRDTLNRQACPDSFPSARPLNSSPVAPAKPYGVPLPSAAHLPSPPGRPPHVPFHVAELMVRQTWARARSSEHIEKSRPHTKPKATWCSQCASSGILIPSTECSFHNPQSRPSPKLAASPSPKSHAPQNFIIHSPPVRSPLPKAHRPRTHQPSPIPISTPTPTPTSLNSQCLPPPIPLFSHYLPRPPEHSPS